LKTADEELKKLKENILKKRADEEKIPKKELLFNGKWFHIRKETEL